MSTELSGGVFTKVSAEAASGVSGRASNEVSGGVLDTPPNYSLDASSDARPRASLESVADRSSHAGAFAFGGSVLQVPLESRAENVPPELDRFNERERRCYDQKNTPAFLGSHSLTC